MNPRLAPLAASFEMNTKLLRNCFDGVDDALAAKRPGDRSNNIVFLACHLVHARYHLAGLLGSHVKNPLEPMLDGVNSVDELKTPPKLDDLLGWWDEAGAALTRRLAVLSNAELDGAAHREFPIGDPTLLGAIAFLVQHESFHIGQIAFLRKLLGLPAMSFR